MDVNQRTYNEDFSWWLCLASCLDYSFWHSCCLLWYKHSCLWYCIV